jgi:phosphoenolpyruvate carboxykinase (ATP)
MLGEKMGRYGVNAWFINTGWTGGPYGVGKRMSIHHTRAIVHAALDGKLDDVETMTDAVFGLQVPLNCPGVPSEVLNPRNTWQDKSAYDTQAVKLARQFAQNFAQYIDDVGDDVRSAGPRID